MPQEKVIRYLLHQQMFENPLPWRVEKDWSYEVTATNGQIIAKCRNHEEAVEIIGTAEKINQEIGNIDDWPSSDLNESLTKLLGQQKK